MSTARETSEGKRRVLLISDLPLGRHGMAQLINRQPDLVVAAEADEVTEGLDILAKESAEMTVLDLTAAGVAGIDAVKVLREAKGEMPILVVGPQTDAAFAVRAIRAGAKGFITSREDVKQFVAAVRNVAAGQAYLSPVFSELLVNEISQGGATPLCADIDRLTAREREVLRLLGSGATSRDIAGHLKLSVKTVDTHRSRIKEKLGLRSASEVMRFASENAVGE